MVVWCTEVRAQPPNRLGAGAAADRAGTDVLMCIPDSSHLSLILA